MQQHRWAFAVWTLIISASTLCLYLLRRWLIEWASWAALPITFLLCDRLRIAWLTWLLDLRCQLAGIPRAKGTLLREHLNRFRTNFPSDLGPHVQLYLESADRMWFGGTSHLSKADQAAIARVWQGLTTQTLRQGNR